VVHGDAVGVSVTFGSATSQVVTDATKDSTSLSVHWTHGAW
jgi:hypothetical protein